MPVYFSTQSLIACHLARRCFENRHYIYITRPENAINNHPTSNPDWIYKLWCEVSNLSADEYDELFDEYGVKRENAELSAYPAIEQWLQSHAAGGSDNAIDRWESHLNTLDGVLDKELHRTSNEYKEGKRLLALAKDNRQNYARPVLYKLQFGHIDEDTYPRFKESKFDPEPYCKKPPHWERILEDANINDIELDSDKLDGQATSGEVIVIKMYCGDEQVMMSSIN